jgi:general secretion pathway protein D
VKTNLIRKLGLLFLLGMGQWMQAQPAGDELKTNAHTNAPAPGTQTVTNRDDEMRRVLREAMAKTNATPLSLTNRPMSPFSATNNASTNLPAIRNFIARPGAQAGSGAVPPPLPGLPPNPNPSAAMPPGNTQAGSAQTTMGLPATSGQNYSSTNVTIAGQEVNLNFLPNTPLEAVFDTYSRLTGRTVLRPNTLPGQITIKTLTPLTRDEAIEALDSVFSLNGIVMIPVGKHFVKAVPPTVAPGEGTPFSEIPTALMPEGDHYVTQIVKIKNVAAADVAKAIAPLSKTPTQVVAIEASQTIILRDLASVVKRMMEVIEKIDVAQEQDYKLEVIPIKYGKVTDFYDTMNSLVSGQGGGGGTVPRSGSTTAGGRQGRLRGPSTLGGGAGGIGGIGGVGGQYGGINPQTGQPYSTGAGTGGLGTRSNVSGSRTDFQGRLQQIVNRASSPTEMQILGDAHIVPDERSNSLIVYANKEDMKMITNIVSKIDVLLAQVLIEAIVLEVSLGNHFNFGVTATQNRAKSGNLVGAGSLINPGTTGLNLIDPNTLLSGATNFAGAPGGFSYFGKVGPQFDVAVNLLASDSRANIMQRPRIQTSHAVPGSFFIGDTVPYASGFVDYGGYGGVGGLGTRANVQQLQVGTDLEVTPYITPDGLVVMDIYQEISQVTDFVEVTAGTKVPRTSTRNAQATLSVRDGDTIMLGGYITESKTKNKSGVPVLKDIPVLGALFRSKSTDDTRSEIIILMHVTVLKSPVDAGMQAQAEKSAEIRFLEKQFKDEEQKRKRQLEWETRPK